MLQHAPWLGRLFAASMLRQAGITTGGHLAALALASHLNDTGGPMLQSQERLAKLCSLSER
ncbi:hypothetical protein ASF03_13735 [Rhizobium sp. Leaf68]|nr:hypothetical protein ASE62_13055 [Rhizobium sp. Leaf202]KQN84311.1 hypothetical protein ASF03_13735 [Rhizobium sp. Leaf68]